MPNDLPNNNHRPPSAYELLTQLTTGPTTREVAAITLRAALKELYPTQDIDPDLAMVVSPRWQVTHTSIQSAAAQVESLTSVLARQALSKEPVIYIDGEHFLTLQPEVTPPVHLPVQIDAIARLINELAGLLFTAFQEQQLNFWNASNDSSGPRWQALSSSLRKVLNVTRQEGWNETDCAMARTVFQTPELNARALKDPYKSHAYLIDIDALDGDQSTHVSLLEMVVLVGEHDNHPIILTYSLLSGYEKFQSLEQLGDSLPRRLGTPVHGTTLQWRLYEPQGNFFDTLACTLIAMQIQAIGSLADSAGNAQAQARTELRDTAVARIMPSIEDLSDHQLSSIRQVRQHLPDWLAHASDEEVAAYSRHMIDLAQLHTHHHGQSFHDDIPPIRDYARDQLQSRLRTHKNAASLNLDKVTIRIESPVLWGTFIVPGEVDITQRSLIDLALDNLTGLPTGQTHVLYNGGAAPDWMTYSYLKGVIESLDIGQHYPALIKQKLLDDPAESTRREKLYTSHLRVQLPLLALQMKIQRKGGVTTRGYRYIAAAMQAEAHDRQVDGQEIVIRPLAFVPTLRPGQQQDQVCNMFVIGPREPTAGPCLLYRPLLEPALTEYPSRQNLIYAIKHDHALRESVLAWMPDAERFNYAQYVFPDTLPSPWTVVSVLIEPATVVYMSGPISLGDAVAGNDTMATLFKANANALVELADRQSVSNAQKRWATLRETGWLIFNAALPFLGRTVGAAAWLWQIMDDLQETEQAINTADAPMAWTALADLFLNLGMALALHVALRHPPEKIVDEAFSLNVETKTETTLIAAPPKPAKPRIITVQKPNISAYAPPAAHQKMLHISGALIRKPTNLGALLDTFKVAKPKGLGNQSKTAGRHLNLYPLGQKWYAPVGVRWFEVTVDNNDTVIIINSQTPSTTGPTLVGNLAGQWFIDTRLRLRGGGFKNRRQAGLADKGSRRETLWKSLSTFNAEENSKQLEIAEERVALANEPGTSAGPQRQALIDKVDARLEEYAETIRQLRALSVIDTVPNYQSSMIGYLRKQLQLTSLVIEQHLLPYSEALSSATSVLDAVADIDYQRQTTSAQAISTLNQAIINRLTFINSRFSELRELGSQGAVVVLEAVETLPHFTLPELRSLEITLARYLCIREGDSQALVTVREQMDQLVDSAELSVQSLIDILAQDGDSPLDDRIDVLSSLTEQFTAIDQRLLDLHAEFPEHLHREPLQSLRQGVDVFAQRAIKGLAQLLRERKALQPKPGSSKPIKPKQQKIIKTRFHGTLVGEVRESDSTLVDIKAAMTDRVIATFHEKAPDVWVERVKPGAMPQPPSTVGLDVSLNSAQTLLDEASAETRKLLGHSKQSWRIPGEVETMFTQYAERLELAGRNIEEALTRLNLTESDRPSAATTNRRLTETAQQFYQLGRDTRINMIKQQPPRASRLEWMYNQGLLSSKKTGPRRRLKGPRKDYMDEYEIRDRRTQAVLWYAHLHYDSPKSALEESTARHLKTPEQRKLGGAFQRTGTTDKEQIEIYRSSISPQLAKTLLFPDPTPGPSQGTSSGT